jgi:hypothetical protein
MHELGQLLVDGAEQLNATTYTTGSRSGQPKGLLFAHLDHAFSVLPRIRSCRVND